MAAQAMAPATENLAYTLAATEVIQQIKADKLTVRQYAEVLFQRCSVRDGDVKAWATPLDYERIMKEATALDALPKNQRGLLHGLIVAVKDVIYTEGMPTQFNSSAYEDHSPDFDAPIVGILRHNGALIFGKTATTEFAATAEGPATRNPHDVSRTPGGSSSGSAAAVADGQVAVALATQTGGSTIRPASFCGVFGWKPTYGLISFELIKHFAPSFDTVGFIARSPADLLLILDILSPPTVPLPLHISNAKMPLSGRTFGVCRTMMWEHTRQGTRDALTQAERLLRAAGYDVDHIELPVEFQTLDQDFDTVLAVEAGTSFKAEHEANREHLCLSLCDYVKNKNGYTRRDYVDAIDRIAALRPVMDKILGAYCAVLTPSVPDVAPKGLATGSYQLCKWWAALHVPVVNVPGLRGMENLPIGISAVAARNEDSKLLQIAGLLGSIFKA